MIAFLDLEHGESKEEINPPARTAEVHAYVDKAFCEFRVNLVEQAVESKEILQGRHSHIDGDYMRKVELACLTSPLVQEQSKGLNLPERAIMVVELWTYGTDGLNNKSERVTMCWFYMRLSPDPDSNYYACPLDLCVEMSEQMEIIKVFHLPSGELAEAKISGQPDKPDEFDRRKIHDSSEYYPALSGECVSPSSPTTSRSQKARMTLHDVRYDSRSLFHRLSLSEMFVPYGDPRCLHPRKAAFDIGNDGAGVCANKLQLGCDCLGHIKYFDGYLTTLAGTPVKLPNVMCCHEVDDGILWKHTNFRTGNAAVMRSRMLVLQTIITASNYEYIFLFYFSQYASIHYEIRATGILSTAPIALGTSSPFGTVVAPGVLAPNHQHLFCLRIGPAINGHSNSLLVEQSHPIPLHPKENPFGVGYTTTSSITPRETGLDLVFSTNRTFKIINESRINPTTSTPVGYKLVPHYSQMLLANPASNYAKRSEFAAHAVWVTRTRTTRCSRRGSLRCSRLAQRGFRPEDWPVMPCEKMIVALKPVNFFERNPALEVPISAKENNLSVLVEDSSSPVLFCHPTPLDVMVHIAAGGRLHFLIRTAGLRDQLVQQLGPRRRVRASLEMTANARQACPPIYLRSGV
ncbi:copper amine oxidase [Podospora didyma]|uniref:Amine oxidase n=1 Tax=Podospora didyma TaxID=330526 RepID=A0AAE0N6I7_9PEZI|nr:copper amine oxidase [Podospora didyma]